MKNKFTGCSSAPDGRNLPADGGQLLMLAAVEMLWLHEEEARAKMESIKNVISGGRGVCCRNMWPRCSASAPYLHQPTINSQRCRQSQGSGGSSRHPADHEMLFPVRISTSPPLNKPGNSVRLSRTHERVCVCVAAGSAASSGRGYVSKGVDGADVSGAKPALMPVISCLVVLCV